MSDHGIHLSLQDRAHLIIDETPLLEECMDTKNGTDIARKISTAGGCSEVLLWVEAVGVDHKISVSHIDFWRFRLRSQHSIQVLSDYSGQAACQATTTWDAPLKNSGRALISISSSDE